MVLAAVMLLAASSCSKYETVKGDPLKTKICTLDNGLKIYMTVNKEAPRIQTYIAVRSGGKNDPSDNTGLAHYLEHIMFKGSEHFGTSDYAAEKPLLDQIEQLYEVYRTKTDPAERKAIYHQIDSISYAASCISIPNEYDKLMSVIGAQGTNAYTSNDVTCYTEDIPSNQIENWAKVQSDRFKNLVIRGFHTELEAVYEEYNMYLNEDSENAMMAIDSVLFKNHPYGKQSVIGTSDHLKNPSISAIKRQKAKMYVPNNVAICVSGDFDPDEFVAIVKKYFGDWEPNKDLTPFTFEPEQPITEPVTKHVYGTESEFVLVSWRTPGDADCAGSDVAEIASSILYNGQAGLMDLDLNMQQKVLSAGAFTYGRVDYGEMMLQAYPKDGQTLEEARDLMLAEVAKLRNGEFDDALVDAAIANWKLRLMRQMESNSQRASIYVNSFIAGHDWADDVKQVDRISSITKADVMEWANKYLAENSFVCAYKHNGINPKNDKIEAPVITPIATNRDMQSDFLTEIAASEVAPIEPVFVDYSKDMSRSDLGNGVELLYKKNENNDIASLQFIFDQGLNDDPALDMATTYIDYLGTADKSSEEIAFEEYCLACSHNISVGSTTTSYSVNGLSENIAASLEIVEALLAGAVADEPVLAQVKSDIITSRLIDKQSQSACASALYNYMMYGPEYVKSVNLTNEQLMALDSEELLAKLRSLSGKQHHILYYGPASEQEVKDMLAAHHKTAETLQPLTKHYAKTLQTTEPKVIVAPYDSRQFRYMQYSNRGEKYEKADAPKIELFNEYFGGGMNTIVFQEMREARGLAYSASAYLRQPSYADGTYDFYARISSQNDKLQDAVEAFDMIINDMPQSQKSFDIAKTGLESVLRTQRVTGRQVLSRFMADRELGLTEPMAKTMFEALPSLTMEDLASCQQKWVKDRSYIYGFLSDPAGLDFNYLKTLGPVQQITLEELFGY